MTAFMPWSCIGSANVVGVVASVADDRSALCMFEKLLGNRWISCLWPGVICDVERSAFDVDDRVDFR